MGKNVKLLAQMQEIDLRIDSARGEKQIMQESVLSLEKKLEDVREEIAGHNAGLETLDGEKITLEENLAAENEAVAKSEVRLRDIKTQKEYQAVSKEIAAAKKAIVEVEEQILQKIKECDDMKSLILEKEGTLRELEASAESQKAELAEGISKLDALIGESLASWEASAQVISPSMIKKYMKLREKRHGVAIAEARNGSCLGCNMNLPPQVFNSLYKVDNLVICPHCQRMLFLRTQDEEAAN